MFRSATFRLTLWYLVIIMIISVIFSVAIYELSTRELRASLHRQAIIYQTLPWYRSGPTGYPVQSLDQQLKTAKNRLQFNLVLLNLAILAGAGGAGYLLARRTLRPIETALDVQSRFTADASHELRTPLTAMRTEIEVALRDAKLPPDQARGLLASNLEEITKLEALSAGLLKLAQHGGNLPLEPCSAEDVAAEAVARLEKALEQRNITIDNKVKDIQVLGDQQSLVDLVAILLDNAIKYSPSKSTIELASGVRGRQGYISVRDHGKGIKASDVPHIFDRFYRADTSRNKEQVSGYGLGLSIAKQIAEAHKGSIEVRSQAGKGSTFALLLPLADSNNQSNKKARKNSA